MQDIRILTLAMFKRDAPLSLGLIWYAVRGGMSID